MGTNLKRNIFIMIPLFLLLIYGTTYLPHKMIKIKSTEVFKMSVFNGNTGNHIEITDQSDINYIINSLNDITFQKGKLAIGYMGYSFRITIYNNKGKIIEELIINSEDTIRYKGFFYKAKDNLIDYDYIDNLLNNSPSF